MAEHTHNTDFDEIAKFAALAERWWDSEGEFKPLHDMNPVRANYIDTHSPVAGKTVLDVGCGGGILSESLAQRGATVSGIDMGAEPLAVAREHAEQSGLHIHYQQITAEALAEQRPGEFDIVTCLEMLEHVPDPAAIVSACSQLVKPGGTVYFSTLNRHPKAWALAVVGAEYIMGLLPKGTHDYKKFIRPSELSRFCRAAQLNVTDLCGIHYNPINGAFSLAPQDVDINYLLRASKPLAQEPPAP